MGKAGKPLVAMMQPSVGISVPHRGAVEAYLRPTARDTTARIELKQGTSMLTRCFNLMFADLLNLSRKHPITHVAMLHDDVAPDAAPGRWLDILMDELERTGADLVSAVCPIKTSQGLTSTAIDNLDDPWVVRRLTMREVFSLPETFGAEDVRWREPGACLLANTGCWVAKFDPEWAEAFVDSDRWGDGQSGFRFLNRIVRHPVTGDYVSQDVAEDWLFSRQLYQLGRRVVCTRKVGLEHQYPQYHNRSPWGDWPTDMAWLDWNRSFEPPALSAEWRFPDDIDGWLTESEGRALAELAKDKDVLEIGSYCGRSTVCMAQTARSVAAVDPFDGRFTEAPRDTLPEFMENITRYGVRSKVTAYIGTSGGAAPQLPGRFDLVFIDGAHHRDHVLADARVAVSILRPGGLLAFHDYSTNDPGVMEGVNQYLAEGAELLDLRGTIAVVWPPEIIPTESPEPEESEAVPCQA